MRQVIVGPSDWSPMANSLQGCLEEAFDRFADFVAVQGDRPPVSAVNLLQESLGIDDDARRVFAERLDRDFDDSFLAAAVLLGLILGVSAAQLAEDQRGFV